MWKESSEDIKPLRTGLTTGSCATACAVACAELLLAENKLLSASITLPKGKTVELTIEDCSVTDCGAYAATIKDAGDDPDVTHGARVYVNLSLTNKVGINFLADKGVGTVTKDGLLLAVGEPAINPVPRTMMTEHLQLLAIRYDYNGGFDVAVGIENGEALAQKTMNPRLGIVGGLSVLGTTGIVRPFSCSAWIASIHQGIDVAKANGITHIAATTGNSSEQAIKKQYSLNEQALIEMGDFSGAVLKHLKIQPIAKLTICGGFGKITKLANGHMDLNSRVSSIDFEQIRAAAETAGANAELQDKVLKSNTSIEALKLCQKAGVDLAAVICEQALSFAKSKLPPAIAGDVWAINRQGEFVGMATDNPQESR